LHASASLQKFKYSIGYSGQLAQGLRKISVYLAKLEYFVAVSLLNAANYRL